MARNISRRDESSEWLTLKVANLGNNATAKRRQYRLITLFVATTVIASILTAFAACRNTYEVHGAVGSALCPFLVGFFVLISLPFLFVRRLRRFVCVLVIVASIIFSIRQAVLKRRLHDLKDEVAQIVKFLEAFGTTHGRYPNDLAGYKFRNPELKPLIIYNSPRYARYSIVFHPYPYSGTGHWYYPGSGYYFEDD